MHQSHIIEVQGVFVGVAVQVVAGFRFVAVDPRLVGLDGDVVATLEEARHRASVLFHRSRPLPVPAVAD